MREIVFDTETSGFGVEEHRIIEIGCLELVNRLPTGAVFHCYFNPEREIDFGAIKVHGITNDKVATAPRFIEKVEELMAFIGDAPLVAHNAEFDFSFLNMELGRVGLPPLANAMVDTLVLARSKLPGQRHNLDALCRVYNVDNSGRTYHGALLDAQLLAEVYVELNGGLQASFGLDVAESMDVGAAVESVLASMAVSSNGKIVAASADELERHAAFVAKDIPNSRWKSDS